MAGKSSSRGSRALLDDVIVCYFPAATATNVGGVVRSPVICPAVYSSAVHKQERIPITDFLISAHSTGSACYTDDGDSTRDPHACITRSSLYKSLSLSRLLRPTEGPERL